MSSVLNAVHGVLANQVPNLVDTNPTKAITTACYRDVPISALPAKSDIQTVGERVEFSGKFDSFNFHGTAKLDSRLGLLSRVVVSFSDNTPDEVQH